MGGTDPHAPRRPIADAIVVAAGRSTRMGGQDKLVAMLGGRPLLERTIAAIARAPEVDRIVLVVAPGREPDLASLRGSRVVAVVPGGEHRGASVEAGFRELERLESLDARVGAGEEPRGDRVVLVHDGARPLVTPALVSAVVAATAEHGAAIPVVPVADTLKRITVGLVGATVDRSELVAAQTPQGIRSSLLRRAYEAFPASGARQFTDEASLLEACTIPVHPVPGDPVNLKITTPADLRHAESLLVGGGSFRVGLGSDEHPFGPGEPLRLGGLEIPGAPRLHGHSDGDVALHAVADALLGAAALGDLGRIFPADARTPAGIASSALLGAVVDRLAAAGWRPASVDLTITGARPRLSAFLEPMRAAIAGLLALDPAAVGVKASSGNLDGAAGAGRVVSATALATIEPLAGPSA
ncbi:MAG TPA: 2-C-methyl-D-erythritol 4-phosphate cytidylyltransferase [Candidatus Sulfomarinibacteraceae bacterium]|nr:2-C-methyl-D-erythritol 4-phosphate cytidylyltransferase [Candidatus Sulfomarinibacteraceae bacterium]